MMHNLVIIFAKMIQSAYMFMFIYYEKLIKYLMIYKRSSNP